MRFFERQEAARAQTLRLLLLFGLTLLALLLAVNAALALTWRVLTPGFSSYPAYFFSVNTAVTLLFVLGGWWLETSSLHGGGERLARRVGAREAWPASREAEQKLCNIVSELAIAASIKPPLAMVLPREDSINAFATGWDEDDAVVAVTQGALEQLTRDELQGLVAHEFSHLREGDTRLNMRLAGMVFGLEMIFNLGRSMCETDNEGRYSLLALPGFAIMLTGSLGWLAGRVLKAAVSRQREYLADARAVQFTRSKDGLGGVLRKVAGQQAAHQGPSGRLHPAVQHMLLVNTAAKDRWLATHPPLAERIRRIYGRPMTALRRDDHVATRPDALF
ncbi:Zn-dependent protease with chaperone function [Polaromonas sp. OV174]|uniref:M48 family metalloprotease n=1 Tax=Polaromonas sp. OV174 TaxID=1855300 RepID=UPI0008F1C6E7|nr:M48 family metalloprotease [Polaromonas sp. OV174]SFC76261.1 Zn-dependent protease with chaperone function [Polaromonas sp. OV174]